MLTTSEKQQLKAIASTQTVKYQLGKNEISDSLIAMLDKALIVRELIKIDVMKGATEPLMSIALDLSSRLKADIVQVVGRVIILFRRNKDKPVIRLK